MNNFQKHEILSVVVSLLLHWLLLLSPERQQHVREPGLRIPNSPLCIRQSPLQVHTFDSIKSNLPPNQNCHKNKFSTRSKEATAGSHLMQLDQICHQIKFAASAGSHLMLPPNQMRHFASLLHNSNNNWQRSVLVKMFRHLGCSSLTESGLYQQTLVDLQIQLSPDVARLQVVMAKLKVVMARWQDDTNSWHDGHMC